MYKVYADGVFEGEYAVKEDAMAKATELCNGGAMNVAIEVPPEAIPTE